MRTHGEIDARSLALHRLVAEKVRHEPALFAKAQATLARWLGECTPRERRYLEEWQRAFQQGMQTALALAEEDSERGRTLRQSSPFAGVIAPRERFAFLRAWRDAHEAPGA
ncbi:hypothetical protein [Anaeromyxobacter oryzisoli]|uniref:hypothetical protein n=1 Tax=Anaeromyxobacter oryzisoli TaxID=2925408 RepID=UPI001F597199|nr:hypothetical protein [Anaeromyxobacter sp. SG63]